MSDGLSLPIDLAALSAALAQSDLAEHAATIVDTTERVLAERRHGDVPRWVQGLNRLPSLDSLTDLQLELDADTVAARFTPKSSESANNETADKEAANKEDAQESLSASLQRLSPWRKGPFHFGDVHIDTEWRSDWKWQRIAQALSPLAGRCVLDVGCGNGYHLWRLKAAGAATVLGIDPSPLFVIQFLAMQRYVQDHQVNLLPLSMEQFEAPGAFDTVLSMGVLSHRREPMEHLAQLKRCLKPGGELLLETLVLSGEDNRALSVEGRYARMRNVWQLPTASRVLDWLGEAGFESARWVNSDTTSTDEQRTTAWMPYESLAQALDESNPALTVEGHPRPCRAVLVAAAAA